MIGEVWTHRASIVLSAPDLPFGTIVHLAPSLRLLTSLLRSISSNLAMLAHYDLRIDFRGFVGSELG